MSRRRLADAVPDEFRAVLGELDEPRRAKDDDGLDAFLAAADLDPPDDPPAAPRKTKDGKTKAAKVKPPKDAGPPPEKKAAVVDPPRPKKRTRRQPPATDSGPAYQVSVSLPAYIDTALRQQWHDAGTSAPTLLRAALDRRAGRPYDVAASRNAGTDLQTRTVLRVLRLPGGLLDDIDAVADASGLPRSTTVALLAADTLGLEPPINDR